MKIKLLTHFLLAIIISFKGLTQDFFKNTIPIEVTLINNGTFLPGDGTLGIWSSTMHPGIQLGTQITYKHYDQSKIYQTAKIGYFHHKHAQNAWQLFTEFGYQYQFNSGIFLSPKIGAGYINSSPNLEVFEFRDGIYELKNFKGRSQFMAGITALIGYNFSKIMDIPLELYLGYSFWIQSPFVNKYVPILPNNTVQLGAIYHFLKKKELK